MDQQYAQIMFDHTQALNNHTRAMMENTAAMKQLAAVIAEQNNLAKNSKPKIVDREIGRVFR